MSNDRRDSDSGANHIAPVAAIEAAARLKYHLVRYTVTRDLEALRSIPGGPWLAIGAATATATIFGLLRVGIAEMYAESVIFLLLALVIGLLGWTPGILLVLLYAGFDLVISLGYIPPETVFGRLISYAVLYGLVVLIPSAQRTIYLLVLQRGRERIDEFGSWDLIAASVSALVTGGLVYLWATVAPYLIRPLFEFRVGGLSSWTARSLTVSRRTAVMTLQTNELLLAVAAFVAALVIAVGYQRRAGVVHVPHGLGSGTVLRGRLQWIGRLPRYALVLIVLAGIITDSLDIALILGALVAADLLLPVLVRVRIVRDIFRRIPWLVRVVLAFVVTFGVTQAVVEWRYRPLGDSEFFPFVLSLAIGLLVFRLLLDFDEVAMDYRIARMEEDDSTIVPGVMLVALIAGVFIATVPDVALADDCSGLSDCVRVATAAVSAAFAALVAAVWYMVKGVFSKVPPVLSQLEPLLSEEGANAQRGTYDTLREKARREYLAETQDFEGFHEMKTMTYDEILEFIEERQGKSRSRIRGFSIWGR